MQGAPLVKTLFRRDSWLSIRNSQVLHDAARSRTHTAASAQDTNTETAVAWIGNSFVYYNMMPQMLASMLKQDGVAVRQKDVLVGGQDLRSHSLDATVKDLLQEGKWDYVVLQDHSSVPGGADEKVYADTLVALSTFFAGRLPSSSNDNGRPGKALLFNTWGHKDGSCKDRPQHKPAYPTYLVMQDRTSRGYLEYKATIEAAVDDVDVRIVPVGEAFRLIYLAVEKAGQDPQHPDSLFARLYAADGYHPSRLGSFLAACVFYGVISGNSPKFLEFDVRGRTLAIEGFLVGKAFIDSGFDDYMINKLGPEKWQPEPLTPELVRPLQAFAHAVLYPDDASEPIELPSRAASARPSTKQSGGNSRPGTESTSRPASQASQQQPSLLGRPLGDTSTPAATLQKAAAKIVGLKTLASAKQVMAAAGALAPQSPHAAESDSVSTEAAQGQAESATTDDRRG